jgi:hypothetical protein
MATASQRSCDERTGKTRDLRVSWASVALTVALLLLLKDNDDSDELLLHCT